MRRGLVRSGRSSRSVRGLVRQAAARLGKTVVEGQDWHNEVSFGLSMRPRFGVERADCYGGVRTGGHGEAGSGGERLGRSRLGGQGGVSHDLASPG